MKAIIDYRTSDEAVKHLESLGCEIIKTIPLESVYSEINGHPDIQLHVINNKIICAPQVYEYYKNILAEYDVICGSVKPGAKYPADIAYNVCRIGKYVVCNTAHTAPAILNEYKKTGYTVINSKQGYAKCSICVVADNAVITSDNGIYKLLAETSIDVLKVTPGNIELYGMDGFIGGASGLINHGLLTFNGDIYTHPDGEKMAGFCKKHDTEIVCLHSGRMADIGSILVV